MFRLGPHKSTETLTNGREARLVVGLEALRVVLPLRLSFDRRDLGVCASRGVVDLQGQPDSWLGGRDGAGSLYVPGRLG